LGDDQKPAPVHSVCNNPARYGKNHHRKSTEKSRQAQLEGGVGDLIHLPCNGYRRNLAPHRGKEQAGPKKPEVSLRENLPRRNLSLHGGVSGNEVKKSAADFLHNFRSRRL
jgi:hypothetical protein